MSTCLKLLFLLLGMMVACISLAYFGQVMLEHNVLTSVTQVFAEHPIALRIWRYGLYLLALLSWPTFIRWIGKRQRWPHEAITYLAHQRIKLLVFFILVEVLFVYNVLAHLIQWCQ